MLNITEYEAKTKEEALEKCLKELNCKQEDLFLRSEFIEGKLFKSSKYIVYALKKNDIKLFIKDYIAKFSKLIHVSIDCEVLVKDETFQVTLVSDQNAILIGKEGRTLNALQLLIKQAVKKETQLNLKLNIDASNYKLKKLKAIERQIKNIAKEVLSSKIDVSLDPMNSYERRLVHTLIDEYKDLTTESIGEGKDRHVIIKYIGE